MVLLLRVQRTNSSTSAMIRDAEALILGSPIYFGTVTGMMRCFMERLM
ncbi:MAG: NAD(P)H-dependent oxidoreductase [Methanothrix sp.]|nr:NAD(P)H-dependent oxidoreductase [Methanothrix sp.]